MILNKLKINRGFTLIELMVATTLFTFIMVMGVGSLITSTNAARASQKLQIAVDNVNFAMESITRELRTGTSFYCGPAASVTNKEQKDCTAGDVIAFTPPQDVGGAPVRVAYRLSPRDNGKGTSSLQRCDPNCYDIVSNDVDVRFLKFNVRGSSLIDMIQPSVQILMKGVVNVKGVDTSFVLQSMSSQRSVEK